MFLVVSIIKKVKWPISPHSPLPYYCNYKRKCTYTWEKWMVITNMIVYTVMKQIRISCFKSPRIFIFGEAQIPPTAMTIFSSQQGRRTSSYASPWRHHCYQECRSQVLEPGIRIRIKYNRSKSGRVITWIIFTSQAIKFKFLLTLNFTGNNHGQLA